MSGEHRLEAVQIGEWTGPSTFEKKFEVGTDGDFAFTREESVEIASGAITVTGTRIEVDVEGGVGGPDDLATINGGAEGQIIRLRIKDAARHVNVKAAGGNINLFGGNCLLDHLWHFIWLEKRGTNWYELFRLSDNMYVGGDLDVAGDLAVRGAADTIFRHLDDAVSVTLHRDDSTIAQDDILCRLRGSANGGSAPNIAGAEIQMAAAGAWSSGSTPGRVDFLVTSFGSETPALGARLDQDKSWDVKGDLRVGFAMDTQFRMPNSNVGVTFRREDTTIADNDALVNMLFSGDGGSTPNIAGAAVRVRADGAWSSGSTPADVEIWAVPSGSEVLAKIATFRSDKSLLLEGTLGIGGAATGAELAHFASFNNELTTVGIANTYVGTSAGAQFVAASNQTGTGKVCVSSYNANHTGSRFGQTLGGFAELLSDTDDGMLLGTLGADPLILGTNSLAALTIDGSQNVAVGTGDFEVAVGDLEFGDHAIRQGTSTLTLEAVSTTGAALQCFDCLPLTNNNARWRFGLNTNVGTANALVQFYKCDGTTTVNILFGLANGDITMEGDLACAGNAEIDGDLNHDGSNIGVFGTTPTTQQTVTGSKGGNAALGSLVTAMAAYGWIIDNTT